MKQKSFEWLTIPAAAFVVLALLVVASATAAKFTLQVEVDDAGSCPGHWQSGGTAANPTIVCLPGGAPPVVVTPPPPPPPVSACSISGSVVRLGAIPFDGSRVVSEGMSGKAIAYGEVTIPSGMTGKKTSISVFEYGSSKLFRVIHLSKKPCDFTSTGAAVSIGTAGNLYVSFGVDVPGYLTVHPGETWYLNIKHEYPGGAPSCFANVNCNFAVKAGIPG